MKIQLVMMEPTAGEAQVMKAPEVEGGPWLGAGDKRELGFRASSKHLVDIVQTAPAPPAHLSKLARHVGAVGQHEDQCLLDVDFRLLVLGQ